jgi:hypothetical protein
MMDLLVATIEHSGTFFLLGLLDYAGRDGRMLCERPSGLCLAHLWDKEMPAILAAAARMPVITTARAFSSIRQSWVNRNKDLSELDKQMRNYNLLLRECRPLVVML